ncbi:MAG: DEAD/DEAH box helicase family protein [Crocinitomicaceae bacterium]
MRNAQLGAIHAIGSHFTLYNEDPALIVMPTGSGKTAILTIASFLLRSKRVLVLSSTVLVRGQIVKEFKQLQTLKKLNVVHNELECPTVYEVKGPIKNQEQWDQISQFDVVVGIPNSISEGIENYKPLDDLFDLILVDEAHHIPAKTWGSAINSFPNSRKIYFTATPFRRDVTEVPGKIAYNYPLSKAFEDKIFGEIGFIPVNSQKQESKDLAIALKTEEIFNKDRNDGFEHYLLVRTDTKDHADQLANLYSSKTKLNLRKIHSRLSFRTIERTIKDLKAKKLDGIITVNMLGEGFDFPNLKIAAIHAPHKSLAATLQFIGRFARTNVDNIGAAKFLALENDIIVGNEKLYKEDKVWNEVIQNLSENRISKEGSIKTHIDTYEQTQDTRSIRFDQISLYNLTPYTHVKIYRVADFLIHGEINISSHQIVQHYISEEHNAVVFVTKEQTKPKWLSSDELVNTQHHLFMIYYDKETRLLFINSSIKTPKFYDSLILNFISSEPQKVPKSQIHKVLLGLNNTRIFNMGLQNRSSSSGESYVTKAGPNTENTVTASDGRMYSNGHIFGTADENGTSITIGYSSGAKVWSQGYFQLPEFIKWCKKIGNKIISDGIVKTNSGFDNIPVPTVIDKVNSNAIPYAAIFNNVVYEKIPTILNIKNGNIQNAIPLIEFDINILGNECTESKFSIDLCNDLLDIQIEFSFGDHYHYRQELDSQILIQYDNRESEDFLDFLNHYPFTFYLTDFSTLQNNNELIAGGNYEYLPFDKSKIQTVNWTAYNCDITNEFQESKIKGKISIHECISTILKSKDSNVIIYDHGTGEVADFITLKSDTNSILVELYHVKGAGGAKPGDRVNDIYEVCGQAIKSLIWTKNKQIFLNKLKQRVKQKKEKIY